MRITPCKTCGGQRLKKTSLAVTVADKNIAEITAMSVRTLYDFLKDLRLTPQQELIGAQILKEIRARIGFLVDVGLGVSDFGPGYRDPVRRRSSANPFWRPR